MPTNNNNFRFIAAFVLIQITIILLSSCLLIFYVDHSRLPAPSFSANYSFNEKIRWLSKKRLSQNGCKVLVIGSSLGLHNIDLNVISRELETNSIINSSSWALSTENSYQLIKSMTQICKPELIIYIPYHSDFNKTKHDNSIDWNSISKYLHGKNFIYSYYKNFKLFYFIKSIELINNNSNQINNFYTALNFDKYGDVLLSKNGFRISRERMEGWISNDPLNNPSSRDIRDGINALNEIENFTKNNNIKLVLVKSPLRSKFEKSNQDHLASFWLTIQESINNSGSVYVDLGDKTIFNDNMFVDYAHFNELGANKAAKILMPYISKNIKNTL